jgi:anti-sigma factor RsiW
MKNAPTYERLCQLSWRRDLSAAEAAELRAWLAVHPEAQADWEAEAALNEALGQLPDAEVPSNFTARVLQALERENAAELRHPGRKWHFRFRWNWLPRVAVAAVVVGAGLFSYEQGSRAVRRVEYAQSVAAVSGVASLPSPEVLQDFDAIRVSNPTKADEELLAALK